ncbi:MAG: hypothetical protein ACLP9L_17280 [Thermoguttaceae bacterium]
MITKSRVLALVAVLALSLCTAQIVVAQVLLHGNQTSGMFGNRTLGQPLVPGPSTFGGGIQNSPGGAAAFAMPWGQGDWGVVVPSPAAQPTLNAAFSPQSPALEDYLPELQAILDLVPLSFPETNGREGTIPAEPALGRTRGIGPPAARPQQPYTRSPELSDRLTQIARSKGLLAGPGIDVYLSNNNVALLQGAVGTPGDCVMLAKVLALEPEVQQIENRLVAIGPNQPMAENPGGGQGKGHPGGGQQGTGSTGTDREAGSNPGPTADAAAKFSGGPITITNPATNHATVSYTLDGNAYTIPPGYSQDVREDRAWAIQFSRGTNLGQARYALQSGLYSFTSTDHGWELYRSKSP